MEERTGPDRRTIIGLLVAMMAIQLYFYFTAEPPAPAPAPAPAAATASAAPSAAGEAAAVTTDLPVRDVPFTVCDVRAQISTDGGVLHDATLASRQGELGITPIWSWLMGKVTGSMPGGWSPYGGDPGPAVLLTPGARLLAMGAGDPSAAAPRVELIESSGGVVLRGVTADGIEVKRALRVREDCTVDVEATWTNTSAQVFTGGLWLGAHDRVASESRRAAIGGKEIKSRFPVRPVGMVDGSVERYTDLSDLDAPQRLEGPVQWFGLADRFFGAFVLPADDGRGTLRASGSGSGTTSVHGAEYIVETTLDPGASVTERFRVYLGPLEFSRLKMLDADLAEVVDFGWFGFFGRMLLSLLRFLEAGMHNWGLAIIGLTFIVKVLFFPLTQMSFKSSQAMQAIQPQLAEIREKYADVPEELNRRTIELFREAGVNPLGGCLPMLVQMPIWIALYNVLMSSVELYQTQFLYLRDLTSPDPYGVLPLVVVVLMVVQQRMMPTGNMDPAQQKIMQVMPVLFGFFFFTSPSGLVVYIFVNMVLTILQQWLIKRTYGVATMPA